jgi:hypothetical protein
LEYIKEINRPTIDRLKARNAETELNQYIIKRLNHHAKIELDNKITEIQEYVEDKPFLPYVWSNTFFHGNMGQAYTQRTRIPLTPEEEALRRPNNTPLLSLQYRKRIIRERAHNELMLDHDSMYSYEDALVNGGQPNYVVSTYQRIKIS